MTRYICLECEEILNESELLEPGWYKALPREQQAITTPDLGCPSCLSHESLWMIEEVRERLESVK